MTDDADMSNDHGEDPRFKRRRAAVDPRAVLAVFAVIGAFAVQFVLIFQGDSADMPPWVVGLVSSIVAFYFGSKVASIGTGGTGGTGGEGGGTGGVGGPGGSQGANGGAAE